VSLWFECEDKTKIFSSQVLNTNIFDLHLRKPKQATMPQTTKLNDYTKEELLVLWRLVYENGHFALSDKLSDDYIFLLDMEKEKAE